MHLISNRFFEVYSNYIPRDSSNNCMCETPIDSIVMKLIYAPYIIVITYIKYSSYITPKEYTNFKSNKLYHAPFNRFVDFLSRQFLKTTPPQSFFQNYKMVSTYYFETSRKYTISNADIYISSLPYTIDDSLDSTCSPEQSRFILLLPFKPFFANNKRRKVFVKHKLTIYTSLFLCYIIAIFVEPLLKLWVRC